MAASRVVPRKNGKGAAVYMLRNDQDILTNRIKSTFSTYEWPVN